MMQHRLVTGIAVVAAVAAGGVGGALIGVPGLSGAQPFPANATNTAADATKPAGHVRGDSALLDAAAKALNLTTQQLTDKLSDGKTTIADVAKQQNVDINKVIDAIASADRARIGDIVNKPWPKFGAGPGGDRHGGFGFGFGLGAGLDSAAKALGISTDDLKTDLAKGQTIAQIAKSKNVDVNKVIDALVADASAKIDQARKDGHLTQAQADKAKTDLKTRITDLVNNGFPKGPPGGPFGFPGRGGHRGPGAGSWSGFGSKLPTS
jgi:uncharacterized protein YidB (DUF937 family)